MGAYPGHYGMDFTHAHTGTITRAFDRTKTSLSEARSTLPQRLTRMREDARCRGRQKMMQRLSRMRDYRKEAEDGVYIAHGPTDMADGGPWPSGCKPIALFLFSY